jgi:hypothetical protein
MAITLREKLDQFNPSTGTIGTQYDKLKYSKDIRGGGYSGQPFIKRDIPPTLDALNSLTTEALSLDYPIRGGSYEELAAREDFARIDRFFLSYPQGKAFLDKQKGLMFSNPLIESRFSLGTSNNRIFPLGPNGQPGGNMLTQVAEGGTGFRHPNAGVNLNDLEFEQNKYEYIVSHKGTNQNRLVVLYNLKINPSPPANVDFANTALNLGIDTTFDGSLFFYPGGPGSVYGLGPTLIQRAKDSRGAFINTAEAPNYVGSYISTSPVTGQLVQGVRPPEINYNNLLGLSSVFQLGDENSTGITNGGSSILTQGQTTSPDYIRAESQILQNVRSSFQYTMGYNALQASKENNGIASSRIDDFRRRVLDPSSVAKSDYTNLNIAKRVGVGNPGGRQTYGSNIEKTDYTQRYQDGEDKVNSTDIEILPIDNTNISNPNAPYKDLIKFCFETIDNDNTGKTVATFFRAFLTGYQDSHSADWASKRYSGRGENFYTYQGHDRTVNFNFKVAAQSRYEMKFLYRKLNYLVSTLYPDYNNNGFMRGNITKLTLGDLFVRTPGILTSLNLTVDDQYAWEIALQGQDSNEMLETPQIIDVAVSFKPILDTTPRISTLVDNNDSSTIIDSRILLTDPESKYLSKLTTSLRPSVEVGQGQFGTSIA